MDEKLTVKFILPSIEEHLLNAAAINIFRTSPSSTFMKLYNLPRCFISMDWYIEFLMTIKHIVIYETITRMVI